MDSKIDVLVIGAGPTGLMMAAELARYHLRCRLIDKGHAYQDKSRAVGIQARTVEIFDYIGLVEAFLAEGIQVKAANPMSHYHRLAHISFDSLQSPYPFVLSIEQTKTENILREHVASLGVKIETEVECIQLEQREEDVEILVRDAKSGKEEKIHASWVIGCDGAHSTVRKQLNLSFEGKAFSDVFSLADVHLHWKHPHNEVVAFLNAKGILGVIPLPEPYRYRLVFQLLRCRNLLNQNKTLPDGQIAPHIIPEPTLKEIQDLLYEYAGKDVHITDPLWMANFHINSRMTNTYRKGRVFIAGDAAHIHSPVGGQGMNTGLQDAFNLAWKLALVHKNQAHSELLSTYDMERHYVGKRLLKATERASYMGTLHNPLAIWFRNTIISLAARIPFFQTYLITALSQTGIRYPKSLLVKDSSSMNSGVKAGLRAPNAPVISQNKATDLYTLWRRSTTFQLLLFSGPKKKDLQKLAERFKSEHIVPILVMHGNEPMPDLPGMHCCIDPTGMAHQIYGAKTSCAYVVRPDTYIGYRSKNLDEVDLKDYFKGILQ